jgi:hypothetical protein
MKILPFTFKTFLKVIGKTDTTQLADQSSTTLRNGLVVKIQYSQSCNWTLSVLRYVTTTVATKLKKSDNVQLQDATENHQTVMFARSLW